MMALLVRPAQSKHVLAPLSLLLAAADRCAGARSRPRRQSSERNTPEASMPMTTTMPTFDQRVERALQNLCAHEPGTLSSRNISAPHVTRIYGKASTPVAERAGGLIHQKRYGGMCDTTTEI